MVFFPISLLHARKSELDARYAMSLHYGHKLFFERLHSIPRRLSIVGEEKSCRAFYNKLPTDYHLQVPAGPSPRMKKDNIPAIGFIFTFNF